MAIRYTENFDWIDVAGTLTAQLAYRGGGDAGVVPDVDTRDGFSGKCLIVFNNGAEFYRQMRQSLLTTYSAGLFSFAFATSEIMLSAWRFAALQYGTTVQLALRCESDGRLSVLRGNTVLATTPTTVIIRRQRHRVELGFTIHGSTGTIRLAVDGVTHIDQAGLDTQAIAGGVDTFVLSSNYNTADSYGTVFDDILFDDDNTAFRGDWIGSWLVPDADVIGYSTPLSGTRTSNLISVPFNSATYTTFPSLGLDTYSLQDPPLSASATIHAVSLLYGINKTDVSGCQMRTGMKNGATTTYGSAINAPVGVTIYEDIYPLNPETAAAWSVSTLGTAQIAVERTV
jgi:hypothetical protein